MRAFVPSLGVGEDPVTGSLNESATGGRGSGSIRGARLPQWLAGSRQPASYVANHEPVLGRAGRVHIVLEDDQIPVGGDTHAIVRGSVAL